VPSLHFSQISGSAPEQSDATLQLLPTTASVVDDCPDCDCVGSPPTAPALHALMTRQRKAPTALEGTKLRLWFMMLSNVG
jgi:hypothetical protein